MNTTELNIRDSFIQFIHSKIEDAKKTDPEVEFTFNEESVVCTENNCKGILSSKAGKSKSESTFSMTLIDGAWINDEVLDMQEQKKKEEALGTSNRYSLSVMTTEGVSFEVFIDGESVDTFKSDVADSDTTISGLLPLKKGMHDIEIRYSGNVDTWTYSYTLREYPKETGSVEALSDEYITQQSSTDFGGFVKGKISGVKSIKFKVDAK